MAKNNSIETRVATNFGDAVVHVVAVGTAHDGAASYISLEDDLKRQFETLTVEVVEEKPGIYAFVKVQASLGNDAIVCEGECNGETTEETNMARRYPYKTAKSRATTAALMGLFGLPPATLPETANVPPVKNGWGRQNSGVSRQTSAPAKPTWGNQQNAPAQPAQPAQKKSAWSNSAPAQQPKPAWGGQTGNASQPASHPAQRSWGNSTAKAPAPAAKRTWSPNQTPATPAANAAPAAPARPWSVPAQPANPYGAVSQVADEPAVNTDPTITVGPYAGALLSEVMALPDGQDWVNDFLSRQPMTEDEAALLNVLATALEGC